MVRSTFIRAFRPERDQKNIRMFLSIPQFQIPFVSLPRVCSTGYTGILLPPPSHYLIPFNLLNLIAYSAGIKIKFIKILGPAK